MFRIILSLFILLGSIFPAEAAKKNIILYPNSADVREVADFALKENLLEVQLPQDMLDETLRVFVDGANVIEMAIIPALFSEPSRLATLRGKLNASENEAAKLKGSLYDLNARQGFWQKPYSGGFNAAAMHEMEHAMAERAPVLDAEIRALNGKLAVVMQTIEWQKQELARMAPQYGVKGQPKQQTGTNSVPGKLAQIRLAASTPSSALPQTCSVTFTYQLANCGWTSRYVLEALPEQKLVRAHREAIINQRTGQDWNDVALSLSTVQPSAAPVPNEPPLWRILPSLAQAPMLRNAAPVEMKTAAPSMDAMGAAPAQMRSEEASGAIWTLGQRTVNSGDPVRLSLDSQEWKAEFYRLLRPSVRKTAWLMASVTAPTPQQFESAQAAVYVDSQYMGLTRFTFDGTTGDLAFGDDPAVSVTMEQDVNRSGETGFIAKAQTRKWLWTITAKNAHAFPVDVRVEDATPQSGDERIKITIESTPKAVTADRTLRWPLSLQPGSQAVIRHAVSLTAPDDMRVHPGR